MNITRQRIALLLVFTFVALMLWGCGPSISANMPASGYATSVPGINNPSNPDYDFAQATLDAGQGQLLELSRKATEISLNMSQAANAAAQATQDSYQRQQMELDYQATLVNLNIAKAEATQEYLNQQTKTARDATSAAKSRIVAMKATQTAQAQATLNAQGQQTVQAAAALTAYPLTATPFAATQAALLMQQYDREQQSFKDRVVGPLIPFFATILVLLVFILVIVLVYRRIIPIPWPRRLRLGRGNVYPNPMIMIDGVIVDHDPRLHQITPFGLPSVDLPGLPGENTIHIEIVDASEPPVAHWIAEVERQLAAEGGLSL